MSDQIRLGKRQIRCAQCRDALEQRDISSLHALYDLLTPSWTRVEVFTALHDLRAQGIVRLAPRGRSDVSIRLVEHKDGAA